MTIVTRPVRMSRLTAMPQMNQLFSSFFDDAWNTFWPTSATVDHPANLWEDKETLYLEMELPGVQPEQLDVSVAGSELTVLVRATEDAEDKQSRYLRRERRNGAFQRVFQLPAEIDPDGVNASLVQGVLKIGMAKAASAKPRKIQITPGG